MLRMHPTGNYKFLPGIAPYSRGVVAAPGFEIVQATLQRPVPYREGFERIAELLKSERRPNSALCGIQLRSPAPFSFAGFAEFNAEYEALLAAWGLMLDGVNPIPRTNVAPAIHPPSEPVLYAFSYTRPAPVGPAPTFVVAGAGELPEGILEREAVVARGDLSADGISRKAEFVVDLMRRRLQALGVAASHATMINVYTVHSLGPQLPPLLAGAAGPASLHGVAWHYARPPIEEVEWEMDLRGTRTELRLHG